LHFPFLPKLIGWIDIKTHAQGVQDDDDIHDASEPHKGETASRTLHRTMLELEKTNRKIVGNPGEKPQFQLRFLMTS